MLENQNSLSEQMLGELVHRLTLDRRALRDALESGAFAERVQRDFSGGVRSGVNGTPNFLSIASGTMATSNWRLCSKRSRK
jgi:predicted DsbA family dithiol-disulfide isomerase